MGLLSFTFKILLTSVLSLIFGIVMRYIFVKYGVFRLGLEVPNKMINLITKLVMALIKIDIVGNIIVIFIIIVLYIAFTVKGITIYSLG